MPRLFLICSSVFLFCTLSVQGYADEHFPFLGEVSKESVNVRAGANTNFEKIDRLSHGDTVVVLGHTYEWYKIQIPTTAKAFIRADYLQLKNGAIAQVTGDKVNVRAAANSDSASLGQVTKGSFVKVVEQINGWCRIEGPLGTFAWVHQDFIALKSAQVSDAMLLKPLTEGDGSTVQAVKMPLVPLTAVKIKGVVRPLDKSVAGDVRYQLIVDGKPAYYLQEGPKIAAFVNTTVLVEGNSVISKDYQYPYPVIHINKITLVL